MKCIFALAFEIAKINMFNLEDLGHVGENLVHVGEERDLRLSIENVRLLVFFPRIFAVQQHIKTKEVHNHTYTQINTYRERKGCRLQEKNCKADLPKNLV